MNDLAELFARDPLSLSDSDLDTMVERLRAQRASFTLNEREGKRATTPRTAKPKSKPVTVEELDLEL